MKNQFSRSASVLLFACIIMLERGSYYGVRAILVLYITAADGLGMESEVALSVISPAPIVIGFLLLPLGLLTDLTFKQKIPILQA